MTEVESKTRRRRSASPRGDFEAAKFFTTVSEDARVGRRIRKRRKHCVRPGEREQDARRNSTAKASL